MTFSTVSKRLAATGAASALAAGALVGATATAAEAATATGPDDCVGTTGPLGTMPLTVTVPELDFFTAPLPAGTPVPPSTLSALATLEVPAAVAALLQTFNVDGGTVEDFAVTVGGMPATAPLTIDSITPNLETGGVDMAASGGNELFSLPAAGTHDILLPTSFTFVPSSGGVALPLEADCSTDAPASLGTITTIKNDSTTTAKPTKRAFEKGTAAKIRAKVTDEVDFLAPTGKVKAIKGGKTVATGTLNDNGVAVINLGRKLRVGKHGSTVKYGSGYYETSTDSVVVKVVR